MSWRSCAVRSRWDEYTWECTSLFGISHKSRDDLVGVLRWVGMSQWSCEDVGMRSEYTQKCMKLWRCRSMHKRCAHIQGHMIIKVMCQIGMQEHGGSACASMSYNVKRKSCNKNCHPCLLLITNCAAWLAWACVLPVARGLYSPQTDSTQMLRLCLDSLRLCLDFFWLISAKLKFPVWACLSLSELVWVKSEQLLGLYLGKYLDNSWTVWAQTVPYLIIKKAIGLSKVWTLKLMW